MSTPSRIVAAVLAVAVVALGSTACSKFGESYNDAPVSGNDDGAARRISMPDGFSNVSAKCDGPNMLYVAYHGDAAYAAVAVAPNDPRCTGTASPTTK